jgi:hypothetical protein
MKASRSLAALQEARRNDGVAGPLITALATTVLFLRRDIDALLGRA